ncbi:gamma-tubulin complex component 4 [Sarotherodon galilaeus]
MDIRKKESGQRSTESERGETSAGEGQAEGEAEGEGQQASSSQKEQGETEELRERGEQTGQERENDEAAAATHSTTGFDLGDKDTGPRQVKLKSYSHDTFGTQKQAFNHSWFEYSVNQNAAFCFPCRVFGKNIKHDSLLLQEFDPFLQKHNPPSIAQYFLPTSQNDTIDCCAQEVTSVIVSEMTKSKVYAIMADKARNEKAEHLAVCFLALAEIKSFDAQSIPNEIQQQIQNYGLAELKCVAQTYDGAAVMSGSIGGVQAHFRRLHPEAIYVHFFTHQLNLVLCNTCKAVPEAVELFSLLECVYSFFSTSLVNHHKFIKTQAKLGLTKTELVQLSNTHCACQLQSISALSHHSPVTHHSQCLETLPAILECLSAIGSPIAVGPRAKLYKFSAVYALLMFQLILSVTEGLHKFLQKETLDLAEAFICKQAVCDTLKGKHSDAFGCVKQWVRKYFTDLQSCLLKKTRFSI